MPARAQHAGRTCCAGHCPDPNAHGGPCAEAPAAAAISTAAIVRGWAGRGANAGAGRGAGGELGAGAGGLLRQAAPQGAAGIHQHHEETQGGHGCRGQGDAGSVAGLQAGSAAGRVHRPGLQHSSPGNRSPSLPTVCSDIARSVLAENVLAKVAAKKRNAGGGSAVRMHQLECGPAMHAPAGRSASTPKPSQRGIGSKQPHACKQVPAGSHAAAGAAHKRSQVFIGRRRGVGA